MNSNISAGKIVGDTLYLDLDSVIDDPVRHGHGATLAALIAIAANEAIDVGSGRLTAEAFRHNAEMLEVHEIVRTVAGPA